MEQTEHTDLIWHILSTLAWLAPFALVFLAAVTPGLSLHALCRKAELSAYGIVYLILARDVHFQLPPDPGRARASTPTKKKRIIFVRHGESTWNDVFNRGFGASFPVRLLIAILREIMILFTLDSLFLDSPLSDEGIAQARRLGEAVRCSVGGTEELRKACEHAVFVTSSLRRAASTAFLAFGQFLSGGRPLWVLSCLQEISRNVDTLAFAGPRQTPPLGAFPPSSAPQMPSLPLLPPTLPPAGFIPPSSPTSAPPPPLTHPPSPQIPSIATSSNGGNAGIATPVTPHACMQGTYNDGNKGLAVLGQRRLESFCEWVFSESSPAALQPTIVVSGHSLWFRTFFQAYLPHTAYHECKQAKIVNCGVVAFDLELLDDPDGGPSEYRIVPDSIASLYGGFEKAKKRSKACKED